MKNSEIQKIRQRSTRWPKLTGDGSDIPVDVSSLAVDGRAKSFEPLPRFKRLRHLYVDRVRAQDALHVAALPGLRTLLIWRIECESLHAFRSLRHLESLGIFQASKLKSLSGLESLRFLKELYFYHVPNVRSLEPLSALKNLEELVLEQSYATNKPLRFESLQPLRHLKKLKCVDLRGVQVEDGSLAPLAALPALRFLFPGTYAADICELAHLAAKLNGQLAREDQLGPTRKLPRNSPFGKCKRCGTLRLLLVGKVGPKYRLLACPKCDKPLIAERHRIFESAKSRAMRMRR